MKRLRRQLQDCTNQIGRRNGEEEETFEIVRAPEDNYFQIEVKQSKVSNNHMQLERLLTKQN